MPSVGRQESNSSRRSSSERNIRTFTHQSSLYVLMAQRGRCGEVRPLTPLAPGEGREADVRRVCEGEREGLKRQVGGGKRVMRERKPGEDKLTREYVGDD